MIRAVFVVLLLVSFGIEFADDTLIASSGDTLHPLKSIDIRMEKEMLLISYGEKYWTVDVEYEFNNMGPTREEQVAFISTNMTYSKNDNRFSGELIDFSTFVNGQSIGFQKREDKENNQDLYLYRMVFNSGYNIVKHHYSLEGSYIFDPYSRGFRYKLTTGGNWAGGAIGDLTIIVNFPEVAFLTSYNSFFNLRGTYRLGQSNVSEDDNPIKYAFLRDGSLFFHTSNYIPLRDINIEIGSSGVVLRKELITNSPAITEQMLIFGDISQQDGLLKSMDSKTLGLLRNAIYAWHGYRFKSDELKSYFDKYAWYIPEYSKAIELSVIEKQNVQIIMNYEKTTTH